MAEDEDYTAAMYHFDELIKLMGKFEVRQPWDTYTLDDMFGRVLRVARQTVKFHMIEHLRGHGHGRR